MEQVVELFALACIEPVITDELSAIGQKLADEMVKQCIVEYLPTSCGTTTSRGATQTTPDPLLVDSPDEEFDAKVSDITQLYMSVIERAKLGERTVCIDDGHPSPRTSCPRLTTTAW